MSYDVQCLNSIYREIAQEMGVETALQLFHMYKGTMVAFPTRLLSTQYVYQAIKSEYNGKNVKNLAVKYNYSERNIRRILKRKLPSVPMNQKGIL